jgi:hypothetical protein
MSTPQIQPESGEPLPPAGRDVFLHVHFAGLMFRELQNSPRIILQEQRDSLIERMQTDDRQACSLLANLLTGMIHCSYTVAPDRSIMLPLIGAAAERWSSLAAANMGNERLPDHFTAVEIIAILRQCISELLKFLSAQSDQKDTPSQTPWLVSLAEALLSGENLSLRSLASRLKWSLTTTERRYSLLRGVILSG